MDIAMDGKCNVDGHWLFDQDFLQAYTIFCCQNVNGGVKDKPTKGADPYHTTYGLSGCSIAQHKADFENLYAGEAGKDDFAKTFNGNYSESKLAEGMEDPAEADFD